MATRRQLVLGKVHKSKFKRLIKKNRMARNLFNKSPQRKGIVRKVKYMTPKKPNSAQRRVIRVLLSTGFEVNVHIPGEGNPNIQEYSKVLVQPKRVRDLPGVNYRAIRGKYDLKGIIERKTSRSKYGTKKNIL